MERSYGGRSCVPLVRVDNGRVYCVLVSWAEEVLLLVISVSDNPTHGHFTGSWTVSEQWLVSAYILLELMKKTVHF